MCSVNGSTLRPSAVTMNGTRCDIRPAMNATSRDSLSSLATATSHLALLRRLQRGLQLRPALQRVAALAALDLGEFGDDVETFNCGERGDSLALGFKAKAGAALLPSGHAVVGDERGHLTYL